MTILVTRDQLYEFVWSAPMRDLAAKVGISDVGLKKLLSTHGVPAPPQGYWNKVHAGKRVPPRPTAPPRKPGQSDRFNLDNRFRGAIQASPPESPDGPFASNAVPEDLEDLRAIELRAIGRVAVPRDLERPHPALAGLLKKEERRAAKKVNSEWSWDSGPIFGSPFDLRRLRLINGIFLALSKRGCSGSVRENNSQLEISAYVNGTSVSVSIEQAGRRSKSQAYYNRSPYHDLPASTELSVSLSHRFNRGYSAERHDDEAGRVEGKLAAITAGVIVAGEACHRAWLKELAAIREREAKEHAEARKRFAAAAAAKRIEDLKESGKLLREAEEIRTLVARVKMAVLNGDTHVAAEQLIAWKAWALEYADRLDPVKSGQVMSHLAGISDPE